MNKLSILIMLLVMISPAVASQEMPPSVIMPDSPLYDVKLVFEDIHEFVTFPIADKLALRQEHLQSRLNELQYEVSNNYNKNTEKLIQKIHIKQLEIEESLTAIQNTCVSQDTCYVINRGLKDKIGSVPLQNISDYRKYINKHSQEVLTTLINNPNIPNQSREGLENTLNMTMKYPTSKISANMVQGEYSINPLYLSMLPFTTIAVADPNENKWYTITVENDKIIILDYLIKETPQYYIYPTPSQVESFENIARHINKDGMTIQDKIRVFKLWYDIEKIEVK